MPADAIHHIYVETHDWGKSVAFWRALGFQLDDDRGTSGMLRPAGGGPYIYLAEVPAEVVAPFAATHWGTREMAVRDPDGRLVKLETRRS